MQLHAGLYRTVTLAVAPDLKQFAFVTDGSEPGDQNSQTYRLGATLFQMAIRQTLDAAHAAEDKGCHKVPGCPVRVPNPNLEGLLT